MSKVLSDWIIYKHNSKDFISAKEIARVIYNVAIVLEDCNKSYIASDIILINENTLDVNLADYESDIPEEYSAPSVLRGETFSDISNLAFSLGIILDEMERGTTYWNSQDWDKDEMLSVINDSPSDWLKPVKDSDFADTIIALVNDDSYKQIAEYSQLLDVLMDNRFIASYVSKKHSIETEDETKDIQDQVDSSEDDTQEDRYINTDDWVDEDISIDIDDDLEGESDAFVGIDLGTSNSTVAYIEKGRIKFLEVRSNQYLIPSVMFFADENHIDYGETAIKRGALYPASIYKEFKRNIGSQTKTKIEFSNKKKSNNDDGNIYILETNVFIDDPKIIERIDSKHKIMIPVMTYEELGFRKNDLDTKYQAEAARESIDKALEQEKDTQRVLLVDSNKSLIPGDDLFKPRNQNDKNDNLIITVGIKLDGEKTFLVSTDKGVQTKCNWLKEQGRVKFSCITYDEFDWMLTNMSASDGDSIKLTGQDGAVYFLKYLRREISKKIGRVNKAVITVPDQFDMIQCGEIKEAALKAGFTEIETLKEPYAAALAYGITRDEDRTLLVYDFGGGTFDVAIIQCGSGEYKSIAHGGDSKLGGADFTKSIMRLIETALEDDADLYMNDLDSSGLEKTHYDKNKYKIWETAEKIKKALSESESVEDVLDLYRENGKKEPFVFRLTRDEFEDEVTELVEKSKKELNKALTSKGLNRKSIDTIILAGGTSSIPCIKEFVHQHFGKAPYSDQDPATLIAAGAAYKADSLWGGKDSICPDISIYDETYNDFGISVLGHKFDVLIPAGTSLPCKVPPKSYRLTKDNQENLNIELFNREAGSQDTSTLRSDDIKYIGNIEISNLPPLKMADTKVVITFSITKEYCLDVEVSLTDNNGRPLAKELTKVKKGANR